MTVKGPKPLDPIGRGSYMGLALPTKGEGTIQKQTTNAGLTLMHENSSNTGSFLLFLNSISGSTASDWWASGDAGFAVSEVDSEGRMRTYLAGSTVPRLELNSSGLYMGSTKILELENGLYDGPMYRETTVISTATTHVALTSAQSGMLILGKGITTAYGDYCTFDLPATPARGDNYEFIWFTSAAGCLSVQTTITGDTQGFFCHVSSNDNISTAALKNETSGPVHFRVTALTSASLWAVAHFGTENSSNTVMGQMVSGTTTS